MSSMGQTAAANDAFKLEPQPFGDIMKVLSRCTARGHEPLLALGLEQLEQLPASIWPNIVMSEQQESILLTSLERGVSIRPAQPLMATAATLYLRAAKHPARRKRILSSAAIALQVAEPVGSTIVWPVPEARTLEYICAIAELYKVVAARGDVKKAALHGFTTSLLLFTGAVSDTLSDAGMLPHCDSNALGGPGTGPGALVDIFVALVSLEKRRQRLKAPESVELNDRGVHYSMMWVPFIADGHLQHVALSRAVTQYLSILKSGLNFLSNEVCLVLLECWTDVSYKCIGILEKERLQSGRRDPEVLACIANPLAALIHILWANIGRVEDVPDQTCSVLVAVELWRVVRSWQGSYAAKAAQSSFQEDADHAGDMAHHGDVAASLHKSARQLITSIATSLCLVVNCTNIDVALIQCDAMDAVEALEEWARDASPGRPAHQELVFSADMVCAALCDMLSAMEDEDICLHSDEYRSLTRVIAKTALMLLKQLSAYHRGAPGPDFSSVMSSVTTSLCTVLLGSYDGDGIDDLFKDGVVQALWGFLLKVGPTASQAAVDDIVPSVCRALMIISKQLPCSASRLLAPGGECDWGTATVAVRAATFGSADIGSAAVVACANFAKELDNLLQNCRCWRMKTVTGVAQRKNRLYEKVLRAQATPQAISPATDDDVAAVAKAAKKADAAMEALVLEEAAHQSAVTAKAAKKARKRASKAAAANTTAQLATSAVSEAAPPGPAGNSAPLAAVSPTDCGRSRQEDEGSVEPAPTGQAGPSKRGKNRLAEWMMCPITKEMLLDPVVCTDGFSYERSAIDSWLEIHNTSFVTGETLSSKFLAPNRALKSRLRELGMIA